MAHRSARLREANSLERPQNTLQTQLEAEGRSPEEIATLVSRIDAGRKASVEIFGRFKEAANFSRTAAYENNYGSTRSQSLPGNTARPGGGESLPQGSGRGDVGLRLRFLASLDW